MAKKNLGREEGIEKLLAALLQLADSTLSTHERKVLRGVLIEKKTFLELHKLGGLPQSWQKYRFTIGIRRLEKILDAYAERLRICKETDIELLLTRKMLAETENKLEALQDSVNRQKGLSPGMKALLDTQIDETELSARVRHICESEEIHKISDLVQFSRLGFNKLRNSGKLSCDEAEAYLKRNGLSWNIKI